MFRTLILPAVAALAGELEKILLPELPGSDVSVESSDATKRHFFKQQIVQIAQEEGYYADLDTTHEWLRLQRPGEVDTKVGEIVTSMHGLGRQFTGVLLLTAYFATQILDDTDRSVTLKPHRLADRSLTFSYRKDQANIRKDQANIRKDQANIRKDQANIAVRAEQWAEGVLNVGLAHIERSL